MRYAATVARDAPALSRPTDPAREADPAAAADITCRGGEGSPSRRVSVEIILNKYYTPKWGLSSTKKTGVSSLDRGGFPAVQ